MRIMGKIYLLDVFDEMLEVTPGKIRVDFNQTAKANIEQGLIVRFECVFDKDEVLDGETHGLERRSSNLPFGLLDFVKRRILV